MPLTFLSTASMDSKEKQTPVGAFGFVRKKTEAGVFAIASTGNSMLSSKGMLSKSPPESATTTGYKE